jgi:hypothetical protein
MRQSRMVLASPQVPPSPYRTAVFQLSVHFKAQEVVWPGGKLARAGAPEDHALPFVVLLYLSLSRVLVDKEKNIGALSGGISRTASKKV